MVMVDNISNHNNIKSRQKCNKKTTRKADRNCISWVVIGTKIICTENNSTCCDATTSQQRTCSNGMTSFEKQPPLFRGHVQD